MQTTTNDKIAQANRQAAVQIALDFVTLDRAMKVAREASEAGDVWLEAGTPLLKSEGLDAVRALRSEFPKATIIADTKTMDAGRIEFEAAAKAGANIAVVMGAASESTIRECIEAGRNYGIRVAVDVLNVDNYIGRAQDAAKWGADMICLHCPIDDQMKGLDPFDRLRKLVPEIDIPVAVAGGINSETAVDAIEAGAQVVIVGGAIAKAADARCATAEILEAIKTRTRKETKLFKRVGEDKIRDALLAASAANVSDGNHRMPSLEGIVPLFNGIRIAGSAVTVRTTPGDWS